MSVYFLLLGVNSFITQTVLLREILIAVNGNEIVLALFLSVWLLVVGTGSLLSRKITIVNEFYRKMAVLSLPLIIIITIAEFLLLYPLVDFFSPVQGQVLNLLKLLLISVIVLTPGAFLIGFEFPLLCRSELKRKYPVIRGYKFECAGFALGGILFVILIDLTGNFILLYSILMGNLLIMIKNHRKAFIVAILTAILCYPVFSSLKTAFYRSRYPAQELMMSKDTRYGRFDVTESMEQNNYYWNGQLITTSSNELYADELSAFTILQHPEPENILLVGGLLNGIAEKLSSFSSVKRIDCLELNPVIVRQVEESFASEKINLFREDAVSFVKKSKQKYDLVLIDVPDPLSLMINRLYTADFAKGVREILLDRNSVFVQTSTFGADYLTLEMTTLLNTVVKTVSGSFARVVIIPAWKNLVIASDSDYISNDADRIIGRSDRIKNLGAIFNPALIRDRCDPLRLDRINSLLSRDSTEINTINHPSAYHSSLLLWYRHSGVDPGLLDQISGVEPVFIYGFLLLIVFLAVRLISKLSGSNTWRIDLIIFNTSLINFAAQIILINLFQSNLGFIYYYIFLFSLLFMLGLLAGFFLNGKLKIKLIFGAATNLLLILILFRLMSSLDKGYPYFLFSFLMAACEGYLLAGLQKRKYDRDRIMSSVSFYSLDSMGAMTGGIIFSVLIYPFFGLGTAFVFLMILAVSSLGIIAVSKGY